MSRERLPKTEEAMKELEAIRDLARDCREKETMWLARAKDEDYSGGDSTHMRAKASIFGQQADKLAALLPALAERITELDEAFKIAKQQMALALKGRVDAEAEIAALKEREQDYDKWNRLAVASVLRKAKEGIADLAELYARAAEAANAAEAGVAATYEVFVEKLDALKLALIPPTDAQALDAHEQLAVAAARRDAIEKCRIALRANFLGPQAEELCGMFTRWMRDDAQTLDAHDADTRNRALEEAAQAISDEMHTNNDYYSSLVRALKREKRGGE